LKNKRYNWQCDIIAIIGILTQLLKSDHIFVNKKAIKIVGNLISQININNVIENIENNIIFKIIENLVEIIILTSKNTNKFIRNSIGNPIGHFFDFIRTIDIESIREELNLIYDQLLLAIPIRSFVVFLDEYINTFEFSAIEQKKLTSVYDKIIRTANNPEVSVKCSNLIFSAVKSELKESSLSKSLMIGRILNYFNI